jgi:uncharacterized protein YebE (UPF0316 family)
MTTTLICTGLAIFLAEVVALTLGTVRTIVTVQGEKRMAFTLGAVEMLLWVSATSAVMVQVSEVPFLGVCYALGFGCGNVVGILAEKKLALGTVTVRMISSGNGTTIAGTLRDKGYGVTRVTGEDASGPVSILFAVCRRRDLKQVVALARTIDPDLFHSFEATGGSLPPRAEQASRPSPARFIRTPFARLFAAARPF